jgi:hypothetical protein
MYREMHDIKLRQQDEQGTDEQHVATIATQVIESAPTA